MGLVVFQQIKTRRGGNGGSFGAQVTFERVQERFCGGCAGDLPCMEVASGDGQAVVLLAVGYPNDQVGHEPMFNRCYRFGCHRVFLRRRRDVSPK